MASSENPTPRNTSSRKSNYTIDEDKHLCHVYMNISQNIEAGVYQKKDQFWVRVMEAFNLEKSNPAISDRNRRSLECRMQTMVAAVSKFRECVQQVEYLHPGCSEQDSYNRAKQLMMVDPKFPKGFKFEHVWCIMKDFVKFDCATQRSRLRRQSSQSDMVPESPISPDVLPSFSLNLCDDNDNDHDNHSVSQSSHRQEEEDVEKSKQKRKKCVDMSMVVNTIREENQKFRELLESSTVKKGRDFELQMQKIEAQKQNTEATRRLVEVTQWAADTNILLIDADTISDPNRREYFQKEQARIISKRKEQFL